MIYRQNNLTIAESDSKLTRQVKIGSVDYPVGWNLNKFTPEQLTDAGITQEEEPTPVVEVQLKTTFTLSEWMFKFTDTERGKYYALLGQGDLEIIALNQTMLTSGYVNIEDDLTIGGVELLRAKGVITTDTRKNKLLTPETIG